ncbi:MAG: IPT/TIG domain-containing protein, partial [Myxococcaceae bacterium]
GAAGIAVVDISELLNPRVLYHVTGAVGGDALGVGVGGSMLLRSRDRGQAGWSLDFGPSGVLSVVSVSVADGELVPLHLPSVTVTFSTSISSTSAPGAFSFTAGGVAVPGTLDAEALGGPSLPAADGGTAASPAVSTLVFTPAGPLPADAELHLAVSTTLTTPDGIALVSPLHVTFRSALLAGELPVVAQVTPRIGPTAGSEVIEVLGSGFEPASLVGIGGAPATVVAASSTRLTVVTPPGAAGLADVVVGNPSGLAGRRSGGYFYVAPLTVASASPRFFMPKGGSVLQIQGDSFLPSWTSALGSTRVKIRGLPALSVEVLSLNTIQATAPPGFFGPADVVVMSADGFERVTSPEPHGYGLSFTGQELAVTVRPAALVSDPATPYLVYGAAGAAGARSPAGAPHPGNLFDQPYTGSLTGSGTIPESFRVVTYDATLPGQPRTAGGQIVHPLAADADRFLAIVYGYLPAETPLPDIEVMPDSLDVAVADGRVYIANGQSGLTVLDATDPLHLPLLGRAMIGLGLKDSVVATRVIPVQNGGLVLSNPLLGPIDPQQPCGPFTAAGGRGRVSFVDARLASDPLLVTDLPSPGEPYGATLANGRAFVVTGRHQGIQFCRALDVPFPPPPPTVSATGGGNGGQRDTFKPGEGPGGKLVVYTSASAGAQIAGTLEYPYSLTDVVVTGDVAIAAAAELGLLFIDVSNPSAPVELSRIPFDSKLSNSPGQPQRLRLVGDLLFVAANSGGVVLVDVSDPHQPELVSGGNTEKAMDALVVGDRLLLAGGDRVSELSLPFSFATGATPARDALVPPSLAQVSVRFNRPLAPPSVNAGSVRLVGPTGPVPLGLTVTADHGTLTYAIVAVPSSPLAPNTSYQLQVDTAVTDQRGGNLLLPFKSSFRTGAGGAKAPRVSSVTPHTVPLAGGTQLSVKGTGLGNTATVRVGAADAGFTVLSDGELSVIAPPAALAGPVDLTVVDTGGPSWTLPMAVLYLDDPTNSQFSMSPSHGPLAGGDRVTVTASGKSPLAPGTTVLIGGVPGVDVDVLDLSTLRFTTPRADGPALVPVQLVRPGEAPFTVGTFSYDLPTADTLTLPGFPPRVASEIKLVGSTLYVGVPTGHLTGLEIFDVTLPERPIRLGGAPTDGPVRGLDVSGNLALLATDVFGLTAVDVRDPTVAYEVGRALTLGRATGVRIEGTRAFVSTADPTVNPGYVQEFDVADPALPLVRSVGLDADALALDLGPGRFYALTSQVVGNQASALHLTIYDRTGARVGDLAVASSGSGYEQLVSSRLAVRGQRAYVTVGQRLYVYDLSDEAAPAALQSSDLGAVTTGLTFAGGALYVATSGSQAPRTMVSVPATDLEPLAVRPANGSLALATTDVIVDFTLPVAPASVTDATFAVTQDTGAGPAPVAGSLTVGFTLTGASVVFHPAAEFTPGATVHVDVDGLTTFDLRPLATPLHSSFEVADSLAVQPAITSIEPAGGLMDVSTAVTIEGSGFRVGTLVRVGGQAALVLTISDDTLEVLVPPSPGGTAGPAAVEVIDPSGLSFVRVGGFIYRSPLRMLSLVPNRAPQAGGVAVELRGAGFAPGLSVSFGSTASFSVRVTATNRATAVAPPGSAGLVDVTAALEGRTFTLAKAFLYGSGAVATLSTPPIRRLVVDKGVGYAAFGATTDVVAQDGTTLKTGVTTGWGGLLVTDLGEPTAVREIARLTFPAGGGARGLAKQGDTIYLAVGSAGVKVVDVSLPAHPVLTSTLQVTGAAVDVVAADDLVFVADDDGIATFHLGETSLPLLVAHRAIAGGVSALGLHGRLLLVSSADPLDPVLHVLDARTGDLAELGQLPLAAPAGHFAFEGSRAFASLGRAAQVAIVDLTDPAAPAPAGTLALTDPLGGRWVSAEESHVAGGIAHVAAGGGKVQRFRALPGQVPQALDTASVFGDAKTLAFAGRYLLVGTLVLDVNGTAVELPLSNVNNASAPLAGAVASVALEHLEVRGTVPREGEVVALSVAPRGLLT